MQVWSNFESAIDEYVRGWDQDPLGKREMKCMHGILTFHKYPNKSSEKTITLFEIYIYKDDRRQGHCRNILEHLVDLFLLQNLTFRIETVLSKPLFEYLSRFQYMGCGFAIQKEGFILKKS